MSSAAQQKGQCICGKVTVTTRLDKSVGACHCNMCRNWGGGPLLAVNPTGPVTFTGKEFITTYQSSEWAERGFCKQCGTHLFYHLRDKDHYAFPAGLFDESGLELDHQIFIDEKPAYYDFANDTKKMTGAEVFGAFNDSNG